MMHHFIINPVAGRGRPLRMKPLIESFFSDQPEETAYIHLTKYPGHATEISRAVTRSGRGRVYSIGGDGTLNEVLNGLIDSDYALGVLPMGSGNDFIKSLAPKAMHLDEQALFKQTVQGDEQRIDCGQANDRYFINIASVGFDAEVGYNTQHIKTKPLLSGESAYVISIFYSLVTNKPYQFDFTMNGESKNGDHLLIAVCNGRYYGGGFLPAPDADLQDGQFDICRVEAMHRRRIIRCFPLLKKGLHVTMPEVKLTRTNEITVSCDKVLRLNLDGEIVSTKQVFFRVLPKRLRVVLPKCEPS